MRQADEVPGSTVQNADIRFATIGISVIGHPSSSPLLGQISETGNTNLGNIGNTDRGSITRSRGVDNYKSNRLVLVYRIA